MAETLADDSAVPTGWRTRQPGFTVWIIIAILRGFLQVFFYGLLYIPSSQRPSPQWTYRQACMTRLFRIIFGTITELGFTQSLNLNPGKLGHRWTILDPAPTEAYQGDFASQHVHPERVGGTWYPEPPQTLSYQSQREDEQDLIVLSFHSGSLMWLTGRPEDSEPTASLLNSKLGKGCRSFWLQYRLAGGDNPTPYPGAMQDAVTAYFHLTRQRGISPSRIVLAGDSTGATIAIGLVRYLESIKHVSEHPLSGLPPLKACLLFSPSIDYSFEGDATAVSTNRNIKTDYVEDRLMAWGATVIAPPETKNLDHPYISPALFPFGTSVPIFVQAGGAEVLCDRSRDFADAMRAIDGNRVEFVESAGLPHDIYAAGSLLGWSGEQEEIHEAAASFVRQI